jgi:FixJ family two-component response regulator
VSEHGGVIAVVDDEEAIRKALRRLLRSAGHRVELFDSAEEWLSSDHLEDSACLVLDVRLPGLSGLELQRHLISSHCRPPIIFITGHPDEALRAKALDAGAVDFLPKPVDEERLLDGIRRALGNGRTPE